MSESRAHGAPALQARIRAVPEDFVVVEQDAFAPSGAGEHLLLTVRKRGMNTAFAAKRIAEWAAFHHETLDGQGYPFRRSAETLTQEARIVAVADVFQALAQTRPYRGPQALDEISRILAECATRGMLDADIVAVARDDLDGSLRAATQPI